MAILSEDGAIINKNFIRAERQSGDGLCDC